MKAVLMTGQGQSPVFADVATPVAGAGEELIAVRAAAISHVTRSRAAGTHYSAGQPAGVGIDGVGRTTDGKRVYFFMPRPPTGSMAEYALIRAGQCLELPDDLDDVTAAAIGIPGVSSWAAYTERAKLKRGETVLVNGATGASGSLAVQIAKVFGAGKVIATGRNPEALAELRTMGADAIVSLAQPKEALEAELAGHFAEGVDVVLDYLWGQSAELLLIAAARHGKEGLPVRYVDIGAASGGDITLPSAVLRSSAITLMGSGLGGIAPDRLFASLSAMMRAVVPSGLRVETNAVPMSYVADVWETDGRARTVLTIGPDGL